MHLSNLLLWIVIAAAAYYLGYQQGRASVMAPRDEPEDQPLPGPRADHLPGPGSADSPARPRGAPPPVAAGERDEGPGATGGAVPPRRTSKPPPAAAGLMDKGAAAPGSDDKADR
jgi:hypothetical protein